MGCSFFFFFFSPLFKNVEKRDKCWLNFPRREESRKVWFPLPSSENGLNAPEKVSIRKTWKLLFSQFRLPLNVVFFPKFSHMRPRPPTAVTLLHFTKQLPPPSWKIQIKFNLTLKHRISLHVFIGLLLSRFFFFSLFSLSFFYWNSLYQFFLIYNIDFEYSKGFLAWSLFLFSTKWLNHLFFFLSIFFLG